jgi:hypothetical protein
MLLVFLNFRVKFITNVLQRFTDCLIFQDGSVRFWDASTAALRQVAKFSTSQCFTGDDLDTPPDDAEAEVDEDEWPPFRKVRLIDAFPFAAPPFFPFV